MASPLGPHISRFEFAQQYDPEKFPSRPVSHADYGEVRGNISATHVLRDLIRALRGVKCIHQVRVRRCLVCRIAVDGDMKRLIQMVTEDEEKTRLIVNVVNCEMIRNRGTVKR